MRIHLRDVLPLVVLPVCVAQILIRDETTGSEANTTDVAPSPLVFPPSQYCKLI